MRKYYSVCDWLGNELFASNDEWEAVDWYDEHENGDGNADLQLFVYDEEPVVPEETYDAFAYGHELTNKQLYCFHYQIKHVFYKRRLLEKFQWEIGKLKINQQFRDYGYDIM